MIKHILKAMYFSGRYNATVTAVAVTTQRVSITNPPKTLLNENNLNAVEKAITQGLTFSFYNMLDQGTLHI